MPAISILLPTYNGAAYLANQITSILEQDFGDFELVLIDDGSTDGTREWLETQRPRIATLISESDTGVYDAMNKGLAAARGEWVLFLGADDELDSEHVLTGMHVQLQQTSGGVGVGEAAYQDGRIYRLAAAPNPCARNFVHHQAAFYRRSLFG